MKYKKTLLIILSCIALGSCFTGCGGNSGDKSIHINQLTFIDVSNFTRSVHVSTPLSNKPATVDVYTNYEETTYDTYTCTY